MSIQFDIVLTLLVAISPTCSSSPCTSQSAEDWSGSCRHSQHINWRYISSYVGEGLSGRKTSWCRGKEGGGGVGGGRKEEKWRERGTKPRGEKNGWGGPAMWVKCNLCWCIVGAIGGMPEDPVTTKVEDLQPNRLWVGVGWSKRTLHSLWPLMWMPSPFRMYACEYVCVYSGIHGAC